MRYYCVACGRRLTTPHHLCIPCAESQARKGGKPRGKRRKRKGNPGKKK